MNRLFSVGSVVVATIFFANVGRSYAGMISHVVVDNNGGLGYPVATMGTFAVPRYSDPGGMPLTRVTLSVAANSSGGSNTFDNEAVAGGTATVTIGTLLTVKGPIPMGGTAFDQLGVLPQPLNIITGPVAGDNDGAPDFAGIDSITVLGTGSSDTKSQSRMTALELSPYLGGGMVTLDFSTLTGNAGSSSTTGGGAFSVVFAPIRSDFTATVTYEFDVVPEPSSIALITIVGSVFTAHLRRRNNSFTVKSFAQWSDRTS